MPHLLPGRKFSCLILHESGVLQTERLVAKDCNLDLFFMGCAIRLCLKF